MKRILRSLLTICAFALAATIHAKQTGHSCHSSVKHDPLIGVWVGTINTAEALPNGEAYFALTFNADHTIQASTTLSNQQAVVGFPGGSYGSGQHGLWKQIGDRCYKVATTEVVNLKDLNNPIFPGIPFLRPLIEYTVKLSKDGKTLTFAGKESFFEITDQTFTKPIIDPGTGQPLVIPFTGTGTRFCPK